MLRFRLPKSHPNWRLQSSGRRQLAFVFELAERIRGQISKNILTEFFLFFDRRSRVGRRFHVVDVNLFVFMLATKNFDCRKLGKPRSALQSFGVCI